MSRIRTLTTVTMAAVLLAAAGCGGGSHDSASTTKTGGTITMAAWSATKSLDPTGAAGTGNSSGAELGALYDTLMRYNPDNGKYEPQTAESLTPNDDFTQWTLKLRPNITFSDGTAYDSAAVVASIKRHVTKRSNSVSLVTPITGYATPDPLTVVFTLSFPWNAFPFALASAPGMIVSPAAVTKEGDKLGTDPEGAGAGPFVLDSFKPGESLTLKKNPHYWGGNVNLDGLKFIYVGTGPQTYEAFHAGEVQVAFLRDAAAMADAKDDGAKGFTVRYSANDTLIMNNLKGPTADPRIRQAVAASIDLKTLNDRVYQGNGEMTTALIAPQSRWYDGVAGPSYDIGKAKQLVSEVKTTGWNGHIRVSCHTGLPTWGTAVKGMLEAAGFTVDLTDQQEIAANTSAVIVKKDFDLACFGSSISDAEPFFAINRDFNSVFAGQGGGNYSGYKNPDVDKAIAAGRAAKNEGDVKAAISTIAKAYTRDVPFLALTAQPEEVLIAKNVKGVVLNASSVVSFAKASLS